MHPLRLGERVPSCRALGIAELPEWSLQFHKRGADHSAKCNLVFTGQKKDRVIGVVYDIAADEKPNLDAVEGGYHTAQIEILMDGSKTSVFSYLANAAYIDESLKPFDWYLEMVVSGALHNTMPKSYVQHIASRSMMIDADTRRRQANLKRLEAMREFTAGQVADV